MRKGRGREAKLSYPGHVLMENRHGLAVGACVTLATGAAEREAAGTLVRRLRPGATLGADKGYDTGDFIAALRARVITPHVAQNTAHRRSAIDGRTHPASGVRGQSAEAQARGGDLRLAEDDRAAAEDSASGRAPSRVDVHLHGSRLHLVRIRNLSGAEART
jgi:hypothetical protein